MFDVRFARAGSDADRSKLIVLWNACFDDTPGFVDFFFSRRYFPDHCVCVTSGGRIVSAMHAMPVRLLIRGVPVRSAIVAGVATLPEFRGRGLMRRMFDFFLPEMRSRGITAITYHPVDFAIYRSLGHLAATRADMYKIPAGDMPAASAPDPGGSAVFGAAGLPEDEEEGAFRLYSESAPAYSGIVRRTRADFRLKIADYASSGAKFLRIRDGDRTAAYCFYFDMPEEWIVEEFMAADDAAKGRLLGLLTSGRGDKALSARLPPSGAHPLGSLVPQNALGVTGLPEFIASLRLDRFLERDILSRFIVKTEDPLTEGNCGALDLCGRASAGPASVRTDIGRFVQFLCGYHSAAEWAPEHGPGFDPALFCSVGEALGPENCFIVDEY